MAGQRRDRSVRVVSGVAAVLLLAALVVYRLNGETDSVDGEAPRAEITTRTLSGGEFPPALLSATPAVSSAELAGLRFEDVTEASGLLAPHANRKIDEQGTMAAGAAVADYDGDGDLDVYLTRVGLPNQLMENDGSGRFTDVASLAGVQGPDFEEGYAAPLFADVNGDGSLDLFLTSGERTGSVLYLNDGAGRFSDATERSGLGLPSVSDTRFGGRMFGAAMADVDLDGDLDLLATHWDTDVLSDDTAAGQAVPGSREARPCAYLDAYRKAGMPRLPEAQANRSRLYLNDGSGVYTDVSATSGLGLEHVVALNPIFSDLDWDGLPDLLLTGDACTSKVYRNLGGARFEDVTAASGTATDENGMGSFVADIDGDGLEDWFVTAIDYRTADGSCPVDGRFAGCGGNRLFLGTGGFGFRDATDEYGLREGFWGWGTAAADFDNDGDLDVVQANGFHDRLLDEPGGDTQPQSRYYQQFLEDPMRLWLNGGTPPMKEVAKAVGLDDDRLSKVTIPFDMDSDGDLDLLVTNTESTPVLYRNDLPARPWLGIRLVDPSAGDRRGIGARVAVTTATAAKPVIREVRAGGGFEAGDPTDLHLGLGDGTQGVSRIEVFWPGTQAPQVVQGAAANAVVTITRPS